MAITKLISVTTRPENTLWFNQAEPEKNQQLKTWIRSYPGMLSVLGKQLNITTWQIVYEFESKERCDQFIADRDQHPVHIERTAYLAANNQIVTNSIES
jgi:hypothetical protein